MKPLYLLACTALLAGCQTVTTTDPDSVWFKIRTGSKLVLNKELEIPEGRAHVMLQHGTVATGASELDVACRFEVRDLGPRTIHPDTFILTNISSGREWVNHPYDMRFFKVFHLKSEQQQKDIMPMVCEYTTWPLQGKPVTVTEIREALGDYFTFEFAE